MEKTNIKEGGVREKGARPFLRVGTESKAIAGSYIKMLLLNLHGGKKWHL
ncbi:MAG: hypothetical protein SFH39_13365 [Candidatus Magnetobacterium sp. LHC-1]|uniref:Uncharacterized protein n=1 Tax=Candidatus Magnetobacterium casense TaxID=1455061 RepID=A0ABS6RZQ4_9BACT|nr:hypothetical protein [Candidatus Magnetobacterium casensis]MBF0608529.1 hypothetical protein [Nitrospirota bacterium]MBV6341800.1 hypothetical protein [Candidatus Magnetobacterium casensis]